MAPLVVPNQIPFGPAAMQVKSLYGRPSAPVKSFHSPLRNTKSNALRTSKPQSSFRVVGDGTHIDWEPNESCLAEEAP